MQEAALTCLERRFPVHDLPVGTRLYRLSQHKRNPPLAWFYLDQEHISTFVAFKIVMGIMTSQNMDSFSVDTYEVTLRHLHLFCLTPNYTEFQLSRDMERANCNDHTHRVDHGIVDNYGLADSVARSLRPGFHGWLADQPWQPVSPEVMICPPGHAYVSLVETTAVAEFMGIPPDILVPFIREQYGHQDR